MSELNYHRGVFLSQVSSWSLWQQLWITSKGAHTHTHTHTHTRTHTHTHTHTHTRTHTHTHGAFVLLVVIQLIAAFIVHTKLSKFSRSSCLFEITRKMGSLGAVPTLTKRLGGIPRSVLIAIQRSVAMESKTIVTLEHCCIIVHQPGPLSVEGLSKRQARSCKIQKNKHPRCCVHDSYFG